MKDPFVHIFKACLCVDVSDLQDVCNASYLPVFVQVEYPAACSLFEAGLQLSIMKDPDRVNTYM